jgi:hypothetical protein
VAALPFPNTPVAPGDPVQLHFYVNNQGPGAATDVNASIDFTAGLSQPTLLVHAPGSGSVPCSVVALTGGGNLATCTVPRLEPGETATIEGSAKTTAPGEEAAFASVSALQDDSDQFDNAAEATWNVECPQATMWDIATEQCVPEVCVPTSCVDQCGVIDDGCGGTIDCDSACCPEGEYWYGTACEPDDLWCPTCCSGSVPPGGEGRCCGCRCDPYVPWCQ